MSIVAMADAAVLRQQRQTGEAARRPEDPRPVGVPQNILNQLMRYIPTETITLYVAFMALFSPLKAPENGEFCDLSYRGRWIALFVFSGLTLILVPLLALGKARRSGQTFSAPLFETTVAPIAFAAWAFALPDSPLRTLCTYKPEIGAFIVLATTILIGVTADVLGKAPGDVTHASGQRGRTRRA
jgi:hypothetical protein